MNYDAIDREASSWVVTATRQRTRLYLTDDGLYSDRLSRAKRFRWLDVAEGEALEQNGENEFGWQAMRYPVAFALAVNK